MLQTPSLDIQTSSSIKSAPWYMAAYSDSIVFSGNKTLKPLCPAIIGLPFWVIYGAYESRELRVVVRAKNERTWIISWKIVYQKVI